MIVTKIPLKVSEDFGTDPDPHPYPLVRGTDPKDPIRLRIRTKMYFFLSFLSNGSKKIPLLFASRKCQTSVIIFMVRENWKVIYKNC